MAESYSVRAMLSATDTGFTSTIKRAIGATESLGSKIKSGLGFGVMMAAGNAAFSAVTNSVTDLVSEINSSNAAWKTFTGNMSMLGKSSKEIAGVKKDLQKFAEQTIYSASDMATTYSQLAAVGTKNTTKLVKGFGGLAAAAENPQQAMKTLSTQATQMAARPNVAWMDFKLMLEQTPAGIAAVAKEMGMTASELVKEVQNGTVATEDFFDAIAKVGTNKSFTKLATQYKTTGQAMDGLKETLSNKLSPAFDVLSNISIKSISGIVDTIGKIDAEELAAKLTAGIEKAKPYWDMFKGAILAVGGVLKDVGSFFLEHASVIAKAIPVVLGLIGAYKGFKIISGVSSKITEFNKNIRAVKGAMSGMAGPLTETQSKMYKVANASQNISKKAKGAYTNISKTTGAFLKNTGAAVANTSAQVANANASSGVGASAKSAVGRILGFAGAHKVAMVACLGVIGPLIALIGYMAGTGASADEVANKITAFADNLAVGITEFANKLPTMIDGIISAFTEVINAVAASLPKLIPQIADAGIKLFTALVDSLQDIINPLMKALTEVIKAVVGVLPKLIPALIDAGITLFMALVEAIPQVIEAIVNALPQIIDAIVAAIPVLIPALIEGAISLFMAFVQAIPTVIAAIVKALPSIIVAIVTGLISMTGQIFKTGVKLLKSLWNGIKSWVKTLGSKVLNFAKTLPKKIATGIGNLASKGLDWVKSLWKGIKSWVGSLASKVVGFAKALPGKVKSGLGSLVEIATNWIKGLWKGIKNVAKWIWDKIKGFCSGIFDKIKGFFGIDSPSKLFRDEVGAMLGKGMAIGINKETNTAKKAATKLATNVTKTVEDKLKIHSPSKTFLALGNRVSQGFANGIESARKNVSEAMNNILEIPTMSVPTFAGNFGGELSANYEYTRNAQYTIEVPVNIEGREVAKVTAPYTEAELNKLESRANRKRGIR